MDNKKSCKKLKADLSKKSKLGNKNSKKAYKKFKRINKLAIKSVNKTYKLINNVCKNYKTNTDCIQLKSLYDKKSDVMNNLRNSLSNIRKSFKKSRMRTKTAKMLTNKICRKH